MIFRVFIFLTLALFISSCTEEKEQSGVEKKVPSKIISLAPSITEILCALDLQDKLVGVTDFCKDPYKNTDFSGKSVGGIVNPNFEKIIKSNSDLIFLLKGKGNLGEKLAKINKNIVTLEHIDLDGVFKSILRIGEICGVEKKSKALHEKLSALIEEQETSQGPEVLLTISRLSTQSTVRLWVAGNDGYYSRLLNLCGARNVIQNEGKFSQISIEEIIKLNPEYIFLLIDKLEEQEQKLEREHWQKFSTLRAVKENKFFIIIGDEVMIPGPRFPSVLNKFNAVLKNE